MPIVIRDPANYYTDPMGWRPQFDQMHSGMMDEVLDAFAEANFTSPTAVDVRAALAHQDRSRDDLAALLSPAALPLLGKLTAAAGELTRARFGNRILLNTPLYISNWCQNTCVYCGFNCRNRIQRARLDDDALLAEARAIAETGVDEVLLVTGESAKWSDVDYIANACRLVRPYFGTVGIMVQPLSVAEYAQAAQAGADYVCVYQETYDVEVYAQYHPTGYKRHFPFRFEAHERALSSGIKAVELGALLGLADFRRDAFAAAVHAQLLAQAYPQAGITLAVPRIRPIIGGAGVQPTEVGDEQLRQVLAAYRLFLPQVGITISTREAAGFRDQLLGVTVTKASAGASTGVGGYADDPQVSGDAQYEVADERRVAEVVQALRAAHLEPVLRG